jgi:hypothetical protein
MFDDFAASSALHVRIRRVGAEKRSGQIRVDNPLPFRKRIGFRLFANGDPGIVDEDIDTPKPFHGVFDQCTA